MGADLYINKIYEANEKRWRPKFDEAVSIRDALRKHGENALADLAQKQVDTTYDKMKSKGYFRDSYNATSLFWQLGLSWWNDIKQFSDEEGNIQPEQAQKLKELVLSKEIANPLHFNSFEQPHYKELPKWEKYFANKKVEFIKFLDTAIKLNEPIYASV